MNPALLGEDPISLKQARRLFPSQPSLDTLRRWSHSGLLIGHNGQRVLLETYLVGGIRFTTVQAIERFILVTNLSQEQCDDT